MLSSIFCFIRYNRIKEGDKNMTKSKRIVEEKDYTDDENDEVYAIYCNNGKITKIELNGKTFKQNQNVVKSRHHSKK